MGIKKYWNSNTTIYSSICAHIYFEFVLSEICVRDECSFSNFTFSKWNSLCYWTVLLTQYLFPYSDNQNTIRIVSSPLRYKKLCLFICLFVWILIEVTRCKHVRSGGALYCEPVVVDCHRLHVVMQAMTAVGTVLSITLRWSVSVVTLHCKIRSSVLLQSTSYFTVHMYSRLLSEVSHCLG
jgi:hypothetical protein